MLSRGAALLWVATMVASTASADTPAEHLPIDERAALLGQWLEAQASQQTTERRFTGGSLLAVGAAGLGYGIAILAKSANNELSKGGGVALIAAGAFGTGLGIFRLAAESEAEDVGRRWAEAQRDGIDERSLARFEGEFYAAAQHARRVQSLARWLGLATAAAGVVVLAVTPFADLSRGGRTAGYVSGSLLVLGGGINIGGSLATPPPEEAWQSYKKGTPPPRSAGRLFGITPKISRGYAGVAVALSL